MSERAQDVFERVIGAPVAERAVLLDRACGGDAALRAEVESLLKAHDEAGGFLGTPTSRPASSDDFPTSGAGGGAGERSHDGPTTDLAGGGTSAAATSGPRSAGEAVGSWIGPYKLLQPIGEGGFGSVFMAEQEKPVARRVALKIIKLGMDTHQVVARFEQERQALALMDHPNIAKVLDAGATETGRPFFVMELVKGRPITSFCDEGRLSIVERLELFGQVCAAVQHAHTKGIIHRDIKPSNVLVSEQDGRAFAKVIDFGIAKATASKLTEKTLFTQHAQIIGTPEYMSPEQAQGSLDIDTRTDVYSLGVLLYELLTGSTPFSATELKSAAYDEIRRIIREVEPPKPSTRLSQNTATLASVAASRRIEPGRLGLVVRGELDWIVMKALDKDRQRRYETASGLAMDVQRFLSGEAVVAAPPSAAYRARKFVRRNRVVVSAGAAVSAALLVGAVGFAWQAQRLAVQRDAAVKAQHSEAEQRRIAEEQRERAVVAEGETRRRAAELQRVSDFQARMLAQVDPTTAGLGLSEDVRAQFDASLTKAGVSDEDRRGQTESFVNQWSRVNATDAARELINRVILKPAVAAIDEQFADQPVVASSLREALGHRYYDLGMFEEALSLERRALDDRRRVLGPDHGETLNSIANVSEYLSELGRYEEAEPFYREDLEGRRRAGGNDALETLTSLSRMGGFLLKRGRVAEAEPVYREVFEKRQRLLGDDHADTLTAMSNLETLVREQGKYDEAEALARDVLTRRRRVLGEDHIHTLITLNNLAGVLRDQRKLDESVACFREVVEKRRRILGEVHPATLAAINNLGSTLALSGHPEEGEALLRESLTSQRRLLGSDHPSAINTMSNLAVSLINKGRAAEAEPMCREALERRRRVLGENHPATLISYNVMGYVLRSQKRDAEAEPFVRETVAVSRRVLGPTHPDVFLYTHNLGMLLLAQKKTAEAESLLREVVQSGGAALGAGHPTVLSADGHLAGILQEQKRYGEAAELLGAAEAAARGTYTGRNASSLGEFLERLGLARAGLGQSAAAEHILIEAHSVYLKAYGPAHAETLGCVRSLADLYVAWDKTEPGKGYDIKGAKWEAKLGTVETPKEQK